MLRRLSSISIFRKMLQSKLSISSQRFFNEDQPIHLLTSISSQDRSSSIAVTDNRGSLTYADLDYFSTKLAEDISLTLPADCTTIAGLNCPNRNYIISMLATWKLGKRYLPLCPSHPKHELKYFVDDSHSKFIIYSPQTSSFESIQSVTSLVKSLSVASLSVENYVQIKPQFDEVDHADSNTASVRSVDFEYPKTGGLILYTSGTTGNPKGVLHTNDNINAMVESLASAWEYRPSDRIFNFLPLHHLHGVLNKLLCVLATGGTVDFLVKSKANFLWKKLANESRLSFHPQGKHKHKNVTLFMAVPTIYSKMIEEAKKTLEFYNVKFTECNSILLNSSDESISKLMSIAETLRANESPVATDMLSLIDLRDGLLSMSQMRLMVSGSAALPSSVLDQWRLLTGHTLLERYGMTEVGMTHTNPLHGLRQPGCVGIPLPKVQCRLVSDKGELVTEPEVPGEIMIKGPTVFKEYLNKPQATADSFDDDGWFKTGDIGLIDGKSGYFRILGRNSVDIIKSGGYKLSALEIEREILEHPDVLEVAVFALPDEALGEVAVAAVVLREPSRPPLRTTGSPMPTNTSRSIYAYDSTSVASNSGTRADNTNDQFNLSLKLFLKDRLALYKQPRIILVVPSLPRNHLGKVRVQDSLYLPSSLHLCHNSN